jgi:hypothetical protein
MIKVICRYFLILSLALAAWAWNGEILPHLQWGLIGTAEAVVGRPATPVSYAGVARRTTVRVATPGVGAPGVGVQPANRGGPVNRVGIR